jgi:hypothetical protein
MNRSLMFLPVLLATTFALAADAPKAKPAAGAAPEPAKKEEGAKELSGISILGNQEAPKSLVIVPWKSSVIGDSLGLAPMLDDSRQPVDKDVFLRALSYYEIRFQSTRQSGATDSGDR